MSFQVSFKLQYDYVFFFFLLLLDHETIRVPCLSNPIPGTGPCVEYNRHITSVEFYVKCSHLKAQDSLLFLKLTVFIELG